MAAIPVPAKGEATPVGLSPAGAGITGARYKGLGHRSPGHCQSPAVGELRGKKFTAQCPSEKQVLAGCCPAGATWSRHSQPSSGCSQSPQHVGAAVCSTTPL